MQLCDLTLGQGHHFYPAERQLFVEGGDVLLVSADAVERLCDHIGIIHGGKLLAEGTLVELRAKYAEHNLEEIIVKVVGPQYANSEA